MKTLLATKIKPYYNSKIVNIFSVDADNYYEITRILNQGYTAVHDKITIGGIRLEFSQDFIDALHSAYITIDPNRDNVTFMKVWFDVEEEKNVIRYYQFQFKIDKNKKEIHFWNDLDYIMENLVEQFNYSYGKECSYIPKAKQISDLTKLALRKI